MANELEQLAGAAQQLVAAAGPTRREVAGRAARLAGRLAQGRFHVSVLGEFKRGKSTVVNALLGRDLLPTGVLPLTAVATEVAFGESGASLVHLDGTRCEVTVDELADFVTEARNPGNERQVARVEVRVPAELLRPGVVLVDTPGIGSIFGHDETARQALLDADGAVLVLSADAPLSEQERELLAMLRSREPPTFYVLNKVDHLSWSERDEVRGFVADTVARELGRKERVWCVGARGGLVAALEQRGARNDEAGEFAAFAAAFAEFVEHDLPGARLATARRELARLAHALDDTVSLEAAALALDAETLARRCDEFSAGAGEQRRAFADERTLLARDVAALGQTIADRLAGFAREAPTHWYQQLDGVVATTPIGGLEDELRRRVEAAVQESFESFRTAEAGRTEEAWRRLAVTFRSRTQARVNAVRAAAADLFAVSLPDVAVPEVGEERERFFYLFLHVETTNEMFARAARRLLPRSVVRRRLLARARDDLVREFDKHAGRARLDLIQRLDGVRRRFEAAMAAELEDAIGDIERAALRANTLRQSSEAERRRQLADGEHVRWAASTVLAVVDAR